MSGTSEDLVFGAICGVRNFVLTLKLRVCWHVESMCIGRPMAYHIVRHAMQYLFLLLCVVLCYFHECHLVHLQTLQKK